MIGKKFCPNCGSEDVELVAGGMTGNYMCADCGYTSSIFPEKPMKGDAEDLDEDIDVEINDELDVPMKKSSMKKGSKSVKKILKKKGGKK